MVFDVDNRRPEKFHSRQYYNDPADLVDPVRRGILSAPGFQHDVFCVRGEPGIDIAVGMVDGRLWVYCMRAPEEIITRSAYERRFAKFHFPTGDVWSIKEPDDISYIIGGPPSSWDIEETPSTHWHVRVSWRYNTRLDCDVLINIRVTHVKKPVLRRLKT